MGKTFQRPEALSDEVTHYCPGCTHGVAHRFVAEETMLPYFQLGDYKTL